MFYYIYITRVYTTDVIINVACPVIIKCDIYITPFSKRGSGMDS